jgi:hypothetical protein
MIWFFLFVGSLILFQVKTKKYLNPYKLIMVFGKKGSGKTTFLTKIAIKNLRKGITVYSTIDIPGTYKFDVNDIGKFTFNPYSVVLIDEVGMIWDNRDFKNFRTDVRDFFKFQRQYKLKVYLFSQTFDVDLKLRNLTDQMFLLTNKFRVFSVARRIDKRITIQKGEEGRPSTLADDYTFAPLLAPSSYIVTFIPRWVQFFNSYDPKPLPTIKSEYKPISDVQKEFLFNWSRYKYMFRLSVKKMSYQIDLLIKLICFKLHISYTVVPRFIRVNLLINLINIVKLPFKIMRKLLKLLKKSFK